MGRFKEILERASHLDTVFGLIEWPGRITWLLSLCGSLGMAVWNLISGGDSVEVALYALLSLAAFLVIVSFLVWGCRKLFDTRNRIQSQRIDWRGFDKIELSEDELHLIDALANNGEVEHPSEWPENRRVLAWARLHRYGFIEDTQDGSKASIKALEWLDRRGLLNRTYAPKKAKKPQPYARQVNLNRVVLPSELTPAHEKIRAGYEVVRHRSEYLSMPEAAQKVYEKLRELGDSAHVKMADMEATPEECLNHMATAISNHVDIWGKHPPSSKLEVIPNRHLMSGAFEDCGDKLVFIGSNKASFIDCCIKRRDLNKAIEKLGEYKT